MKIALIAVFLFQIGLVAKPSTRPVLSTMTDAELIDIIKKAPSNHHAISVLARRKNALRPVLPIVFAELANPRRSSLESVEIVVSLSYALPEISEILNEVSKLLDSSDELLLEKALLFVRIVSKHNHPFEPKVLSLLKHRMPKIRLSAALTALTINPRLVPEATRVLIEIFDSENLNLRIRAARLLLEISPRYFQTFIAQMINHKASESTIAALEILINAPDFELSSETFEKILNLLNVPDQKLNPLLCLTISKYDKPHQISKISDAYRQVLSEPEISVIGQKNAKSCMLLLLQYKLIGCDQLKKFTIGAWAYDSDAKIKALHESIWQEAQKESAECMKH